MCLFTSSFILFLSSGAQLTWSIKVWSGAPLRQGKSAMPMCSMEQKRCISVASRGWQRGEKWGHGDDEWGTKNIYPAAAPTHHQYFSCSWSHLKKFTCPQAVRSVSQRSTLRWMISYGLTIVPADWLSARTRPERTASVSVKHAGTYCTLHNIKRRSGGA